MSSTHGSGAYVLRPALLGVNRNPGADYITFQLYAAGPNFMDSYLV